MVEGALNAARRAGAGGDGATATSSSATATAVRTSRRRGSTAAATTRAWLAISVTDDAQWEALVDALGTSRVGDRSRARDVRRSPRAPRRARRSAGDWSRERDAGRGRGAARRARRTRRRRSRPALHDRPSAVAGAGLPRGDRPPGRRAMPTPTWPFRFASVDRWLRTPAPTLGQHNHEILVDDLGVDDADLPAIRRSADHRRPPARPPRARHPPRSAEFSRAGRASFSACVPGHYLVTAVDDSHRVGVHPARRFAVRVHPAISFLCRITLISTRVAPARALHRPSRRGSARHPVDVLYHYRVAARAPPLWSVSSSRHTCLAL